VSVVVVWVVVMVVIFLWRWWLGCEWGGGDVGRLVVGRGRGVVVGGGGCCLSSGKGRGPGLEGSCRIGWQCQWGCQKEVECLISTSRGVWLTC